MQNLSGENVFYLHENKESLSYQWLYTWPRFETEALGNSRMAHSNLLWDGVHCHAGTLVSGASFLA